MNFSDLSLSLQLIQNLEQLRIVEPLPIQELVIPAVLEHKNLLVSSQTGSGKTLAYLLPLIEQLLRATDGESEKSSRVKLLILAPTRELAQQIYSVSMSLCRCSAVRTSVIVGGVEYAPQKEILATLPDIVIATPGRIIDLMEQGVVDIREIDFFVLDEVDQMLDLGFREPIARLAALRSVGAQSLCFSATLPFSVVELVGEIVEGVEELKIAEQSLSVEQVEHFGYYVSFEMMDRLLIHLLRTEAATKSIIFTRSRKMADRVVGLLAENSIAAEAIHSDRSQAAREHILARFREGETSTLVATDVIARGIDIDTVTHVFNFGLPQTPEQYIHRSGRTGRCGRMGRTISIFTPDERTILNDVCRLMKRHIIIDSSHPYMTPDITRALLTPISASKQKTKVNFKRR